MAVTTFVDLVVAVLLIIIAVFGVVLNVIVIASVYYNRGLRQPFTLILSALCAAHILEYVIVLPLTVFGELLHVSSGWPFGDGTCRFMKYVFYSMAYIIAYLAVVLVVDKLLMAQQRPFWTDEAALNTCCILAVVLIVLNAGIVTVYGTVDEYVDATTKRTVCSLDHARDAVVLVTFFVFSYVVPILAAVALLAFLTHMIEVRKKFQLDSVIDAEFAIHIMVIVFVLACYGILRLLWHIDRMLLVVGAMHYDMPHFILQSIAEVLWYLSGVLIPAFIIYSLPSFPDGVKAVCCCTDPVDMEYEESLTLMPVVTTVADPRRYDGSVPRPLARYPKHLTGSASSVSSRGSTRISSVSTPASTLPREGQPWRIVRTLERPVGQVEHKEEQIKVQRERLSKTKN